MRCCGMFPPVNRPHPLRSSKAAQFISMTSSIQTESLRIHHSKLDNNDMFVRKDDIIDLSDEPNHYELCKREQQYLLKAIQEDLDLTDHMNAAMNSLKIVLAADKSIKTSKTIELL